MEGEKEVTKGREKRREELVKSLREDSKVDNVKMQGEQVSGNIHQEFQDDELKVQQRQEVSATLPEHLVEKILARVPFPSVFKTRVLSKSWLARLSPISSQEDEQKKLLAISFQKQMSEQSLNWKTFCPVYVSEGNLTAYDQASHTWQKLPSLSFLPENLIRFISQHDARPLRFIFPRYALPLHHSVCIQGALLLFNICPAHDRSESSIYVANILTRTWKKLPPRPHPNGRWSSTLKQAQSTLVCLSPDTYKVITVRFDSKNYVYDRRQKEDDRLVQIYDSTSATWSSKTLNFLFESPDETWARGPGVYVDGVLYMQIQCVQTGPWNSNSYNLRVVSLNIKEETLEEVPTTCNFQITSDFLDRKPKAEPVLCNGDVLICTDFQSSDGPGGRTRTTTSVMKLDPGLGHLSRVARGPPPALLSLVRNDWDLSTPIGDGDCIFFHARKPHNEAGSLVFEEKVMTFNVQEDQWSCFAFPERALLSRSGYIPRVGYLSSSFRPGLNPFALV